MTVKDLVKENKTISKSGKGFETRIINSYIDDCVENIVNNFGAYWPDGTLIMAALIPIRFKNKVYTSKALLYSQSIRQETINPYYPDHYLNIRATGLPMRLHGVEFKAAPSLSKRCSVLCYGGKYYKKLEV